MIIDGKVLRMLINEELTLQLHDDDHGRIVGEWCQLLNDESSNELQKSIENIRAVDRAGMTEY